MVGEPNRRARFEFYDSIPSGRSFGADVFRNLRRWLQDESENKRKQSISLDSWEDYAPLEIPHQDNAYDCGLFTIKFGQCLALDLDLSSYPFGQQHMDQLRQRAILEMMAGRLQLVSAA